mgnify:CR=1 FL=1
MCSSDLFAQFVVSWAFGALVLVTLISIGFHFVNGSIRPQDRVQRVTPQAKVHISVLIAGGTLLRAANYWLSRYELTGSQRGVVRGALYTDVNAQLPATNLMILVSFAVTLLLLWNVRQRGWRLPVLGVGLWVVVAVVAGSIYPALVQRFVVQPNVSTRELPYIQRNIKATKAAMGLENVERVSVDYSNISASDVQADDAPLRDVRSWTPRRCWRTARRAARRRRPPAPARARRAAMMPTVILRTGVLQRQRPRPGPCGCVGA